MKKIRTIISYYNGHEFIKEQVDSILNQNNIDDFDHEVFIYDDGSEKYSIEKLILLFKNYQNVKILIDNKNDGAFKRYLSAWCDAYIEGINYVFWSDQDDVFMPDKYRIQINSHIKFNKSLIVTSDYMWDFKNEIRQFRYKTGFGHNMSFDMLKIKEKYNLDINFIKKYIFEINKNDPLLSIYHDVFISFFFIHKSDFKGIWGDGLALHRNHNNSISNSGTLSGRPYMIWADSYNNYFIIIKPHLQKMLNINLSINDYNKRYYLRDPLAKSEFSILPWIKWKFDNLTMYTRLKSLRNIVRMTSYKKKVSSKEWKSEKIKHKIMICEIKNNTKNKDS